MERLGDVLTRWLAGVEWLGFCRSCGRRPLTEGARCLLCGGLVLRERVRA